MTDEPPRNSLGDKDGRERVLVIVLALAGAVSTLALSMLPVIAGVPHNPVFAALIGAVNTIGYLAIILIAAQSPLRWWLVRRVSLAMIGASVLAAIAAVTILDDSSGGSGFLLAMSALMAVVIVAVSNLRDSSPGEESSPPRER
ncbi:MFS transporter [Gordonia insulae]|uniref:Uncharacterized protein n=1 Tax=Gordonia insulae TaxID=2420509 RepID=A0A3G8JQ90_9ACTN|nr:hypothetical protein [Gordonia insulae]AZG47136.1 hypothetical protein D7316_03744 [Gordonia insulae]